MRGGAHIKEYHSHLRISHFNQGIYGIKRCVLSQLGSQFILDLEHCPYDLKLHTVRKTLYKAEKTSPQNEATQSLSALKAQETLEAPKAHNSAPGKP